MDQVHPLLQEKPTIVLPTGDPEEEVSAPVVGQNEGEQTEGETPEEEFYRLSKANLYKELDTLIEKDDGFRNKFNTLVGRKVAREYKPELDELRAKVAQLEAEKRSISLAAIPKERVNQLLQTDPEFRKIYDTPVTDPETIRQKTAFERSIFEILDSVSDVVPIEVLERYRQATYTGHYDLVRDENENPVMDEYGRPREVKTPQEALTQLHKAVNRYARYEIQKQYEGAQAKPQAEQPQATAPTTKKEQPRPDMTPPAGTTGKPRMSIAEYKALTPPQRIAMYPTQEDFENDFRSGIIYKEE